MKLSEKEIDYAAKRWGQGATMQQIADELTERGGFSPAVHKQTIQYIAAKDRNRFPKRTRAAINDMISVGIKRAMANGFEPGPGLQDAAREKKDRDELRIDFEW